jgi:hypothetical protein
MSILATVEHGWSLLVSTRRDDAAPDVGAVLTLSDARTADPIAGVSAPQAASTPHELAAQSARLDENPSAHQSLGCAVSHSADDSSAPAGGVTAPG